MLGVLKSAGAPTALEIEITGESLFNDGVAVVVFIILLQLATGEDVSAGSVVWLFVEEALGGLVFGLLIGYLASRLLRSIDAYDVEVPITLALVMGGYALATRLHLSGPIAMVVAGLMIGNHGRALAMSGHTRQRLDTSWELVDEILNAVLFVLLGLEIVVLSVTGAGLATTLMAIPLVLLLRFVRVGTPVALMSRLPRFEFEPGTVKILTWGGLRGGISVALALSLPPGPERDLILTVTCGVVMFAILVQGLTIGRVVRASVARPEGVA